MEPYAFEFTAIRGVQAGSAYYVALCPLKLVPQLFRFHDESMPAQLRAQRVLNRARVPTIARYIADHPHEYILSSLCASVDGEIEFEPAAANGPLRSVGRLRISMLATLLLNDGQHRRAAIEEVLRERPYLGDESISVVLFVDRGLGRSQQMFADLNIHAVRPSKSLGVLYNHRDPLARLTREVIAAVPVLREFTELEKTAPPTRSLKLFSLSSLYQATAELVGKMRDARVSEVERDIAIAFWQEIVSNMPDWLSVQRREVTAAELRRDYVHAHGIVLHALGIAGAQLISLYPRDWIPRLREIAMIDWSRANKDLWEGRALIGGRINKARNNVVLVSNVICRALGIPPTAEGERIENLHEGTIPLCATDA
jgi:DNA sulfur modification protein DndB